MAKTITAFLSFVAFFFIPGPVLANGPPINSDTAFVTGLNGAAFRSFFKVVRKSRSGLGDITIITNPLILPYELIDNRLVVIGVLPLLLKDRHLANKQHRTSGFGIGDISLLAKVNVFQKDWHAGTFRIAGKGGLQFPTGDTNHADNLGVLPRPLQNGKGSWNPILGVVGTFLLKRFGINGGVAYQLNTEGKIFEFGDELKFDLAFAFRVLPAVYKEYPAHQVNAFLEFNGSWTQKNKLGGVIDPNSGGTVLFLSPGIQYMYQTVIFEASFQYAILKSFNGFQLESEWTFNLGFRWLIV